MSAAPGTRTPIPGAGVDRPSTSTRTRSSRARWSTHFGKRDEVSATCATLRTPTTCGKIRFATEVEACQFDGGPALAGPGDQPHDGGQELTADAVITAVGSPQPAKIPALPGLDTFRGPLFHSARGPRTWT